jgi:phosphoglycerate dehydrogenase-like enzyme
MLDSRCMAAARRIVLVTSTEYMKAAAVFRAESALDCRSAPDAEMDLADAIRGARASHVVVGSRRYEGALYEALPVGGVIARFGVGHDGIDKMKATAAGLLCTNTPGVLNQSVAEHTMLLIGAAARSMVTMAVAVARHGWDQTMGAELEGKTLAIVGCGGIGCAVARIASAGYGMQVVGCCRADAPPPPVLPHFREVTSDFVAAVRRADFVSLHMSASRDNLQWLNRERLALLGQRTWLINTARGSLVDEAALFAALAGGRLGGAALDVFAQEPYVPSESGTDLRMLANVIMTPHVASNTVEANRRMAQRALQNIALAESRRFEKMDLLNRDVLA